MKKLLTILVILVLGFAAIIFVLKQQEAEQAKNEPDGNSEIERTIEETFLPFEEVDIEETTLRVTTTTREPAIENETEESLAETAAILSPEMEAKLEDLIPDLGGLEKVVIIPPLIDAVENNTEIPGFVVKAFEDKGIDLGDAEGNSYKEQLEFFVQQYREEILQWLRSRQ